MEIVHVSFQVEQPKNVPKEGMFFPSFEEAQTFYVAYADSCAFSGKKRHHTRLFATSGSGVNVLEREKMVSKLPRILA